jgi:hypothetical protein
MISSKSSKKGKKAIPFIERQKKMGNEDLSKKRLEATRKHLSRTCFHFNGIQNKVCNVGIEYASFSENGSNFGLAHKIPCITTKNDKFEKGHCDSFRAYTENEILEEHNEFERALSLLEKGLSPCCKAPIDESEVITKGRFKGHGKRYCSKCGEITHMV